MTQEHIPPQRSLITPRAEAPREIIPFDRDGATGEVLGPDLVRALILYGQRYGLDPYAGELIYYRGLPYVTERGAVHNAVRSQRYRGHAVSIVPPEERKAMGLQDGDIAYRCEVWVKDVAEPIVEFGEVTAAELEQTKTQVASAVARDRDFRETTPAQQERETLRRLQFLPLMKSPGKMARARAIRRAHLLAFPLKGETSSPPQ